MVQSDLGSLRTGKASAALVDDLAVMVYGGQQKLKIKELAGVSSPDHETLIIEPWDKSIIGEIRQGILSANIGMNPSINGQIIRISFPPMTTEDREKYTKLLATKLESGRVMIRQVRQEGMHDIKKAFEEKTLSEDEKFAEEKKLQEITDEFVEKINVMGEKKKEELLQI
ncbi:MAG: Ribosome-recycling factor [Candidatus Woesebacteria bacterium GW2011_GWD1_38_10]|uniref:Ribosome-recycling factor n=1 Tax=Candidatus Woesebacteria bacterium GW2011_GWD1_38_10 TaxID=1618592 RepID=A0A0G0LAE3_9BACT|nr:MAG: Ribosome-recycling factor [Candidatus Woesebacteria bacterium GW2011_GWD1_38_10]